MMSPANQEGQELIEYFLFLALVAVVSAALFICVTGSVAGIWTPGNGHLDYSQQSAEGRTK
jgi:Flp pilus assembly pilin Flp